METITYSREETVNLGKTVAKKLNGKTVIALKGGMGMGKTAFCEGIAKGLGITDYIVSPTFNIVNIYYGDKTLYHFDMYRVSGLDDLLSTGYFDYLDDENGIMLIEWSENVLDLLPEYTKFITIQRINDSTRKFSSEDF